MNVDTLQNAFVVLLFKSSLDIAFHLNTQFVNDEKWLK